MQNSINSIINSPPHLFLEKKDAYFQDNIFTKHEVLNNHEGLLTTKEKHDDLLKLTLRYKSDPINSQTINSFISNSQKSSFLHKSNNFNNSSSTKMLSKIEEQILKSKEPIEFPNGNSNEDIEVFGQKGFWLNKNESINWHDQIPLCNYKINQDDRPEFIYKKSKFELSFIQELAVRYLRPPTPPAPGEIVIVQEPNKQTQPAPPLVIRQQPARPITPEPLVIREAPPQPPAAIGKKLITISGKRLPPPPRKVVIERLPQLPTKPPDVIIEKWLPFKKLKRKVIFQRSVIKDPIKQKNIVIQWEQPQVHFLKQFKDLGVTSVNPQEYIDKYRDSLWKTEDLPDFIHEITPHKSLNLTMKKNVIYDYDLEGDLYVLNSIDDLNKFGLGKYKEYLKKNKRLSSSSSYNISSSSPYFSTSMSNSSIFELCKK